MIDIHVHFFPERVFQAIWRFFEDEQHGLWNIRYKLYGKRHVDTLQEMGVERFTTLIYAHRPGLAAYLNEFVRASAERYPALIPFGTIFAGDGDCRRAALTLFETYKFYGIKLHPFVSGERVDDERFFAVYDVMQALGKVLVCHTASGPVYPSKDGAVQLRKVLEAFPRLKVVVAHCGAVEYGEYASLADTFEHVYFDTAMNCVHFDRFHNNCPGKEFFINYQDRILFGSDFPNLPYEYAHQVSMLQKLNLGDAIEKKIFRENAIALLGL